MSMTPAEMARAARAAYMREYRKKNKQKIKEQQEQYWEKKYRELQK
ncbi:hypothetical protein KQI86_19165 [Clostridium sp. MSJ-11]|uniref:Uncharacterized protein n=1 Tax=Clostridium mobile TaxID=2841512 RepID=A0ABS6EMG6_9CLOT|nr:hypothetical protein [Clostridium mobile]MBU5486424.1 hypothetical protein [Clostridium mobile]